MMFLLEPVSKTGGDEEKEGAEVHRLNILFNYKHYKVMHIAKKKKKVLFQTQKRSYISRNMENS